MSVAGDFLQNQVLRIFDTVLEQTGSEQKAQLAAQTVQINGLADMGAPPGVIRMLEEDLRELRELVEYEDPALIEPVTPSFPGGFPPVPSIPGLGAIKDWLWERIKDLGDVVGAIAGAVLDAAVAVVMATLPTLAEVALSLVGVVTDSVGFIGENLAELDDVALALAEGVGGGLESAAGELGNRIVSAAGLALSAFIRPLEDVAVPIRSGTPQVLEPGPRA